MFGIGKCFEKYGFIFYNCGVSFVFEKNYFNEFEGNKRFLYIIIFVIFKGKNDMIMVFGVMGGDY